MLLETRPYLEWYRNPMTEEGDVAEADGVTRREPRSEKGFLEERPGHKSAMRIMSAAAFVFAAGFGVFTLVDPGVGKMGVYITFGFLLAAFAPKALQKFAEETIAA